VRLDFTRFSYKKNFLFCYCDELNSKKVLEFYQGQNSGFVGQRGKGKGRGGEVMGKIHYQELHDSVSS
jgi:hypothetical protein